MPASGIERFLTLIGGEANLPPELPPQAQPATTIPTQDEPSEDSEDPFSGLPSVQEVIEQEVAAEEAARAHSAKPQVHTQPQFTPKFLPSSASPLSDADAHSQMPMGEPAPRGISFSPFIAVTRFCYKFVSHQWSQPLATAFFDANKIYHRAWDIYYIWSDQHQTARPTTFVPEHQLQALINDINQAFPEAHISLTEDLREDGLVVNLDNLPDELRPLSLGRTTSREQYDYLVAAIPYPSRPPGTMPDDRSLQAFRDMIDKMVELGKAKSKAKKKANQQVAIQRRQEMSKQVLRAQRYLGLLPKKDDDLLTSMNNLTIPPLDPNTAVPHPFEQDVIIIAIDVEAYERSPKTITEVGVATLDTRDLRGEAPGADGGDWRRHIRGRHFRVVEYKHLRNHEFVEGCPDAFRGEFGTSEFVAREELPSVLTSCFHQPFSRREVDPATVATEEESSGPDTLNEANSRSTEKQSSSPDTSTEVNSTATPEEKRTIVLLGHDINQDITYLHSIGFSVLNRSHLAEPLDTATMFKSYTRDNNATSLGRVLLHFDIDGWYLHNAGNDAVYTMQALLAIAVRAAAGRGSEEAGRKVGEALEKRTADAVEMAKERVRDEAEGWSLHEDEGGESGYAIVPSMGEERREAQKPVFGPPRPVLYTMGGAVLDV
ncbi:hypothetical protein B0A55_06208 [Friedmanniomyces simplex]|uniref:Gfd2/YDR514C-like C-terminal domain-containing protein n=1 Tax=Friedmanniomyces simplex TaxID=329884 RepID=A0A4U0XFZ5_9PEZI|nr:hypothetical protein B0A55_06208 [Friedmanniomyces simplex]